MYLLFGMFTSTILSDNIPSDSREKVIEVRTRFEEWCHINKPEHIIDAFKNYLKHLDIKEQKKALKILQKFIFFLEVYLETEDGIEEPDL